MRKWIIAMAIAATVIAGTPAWAHQADPVRQAERAGRWLQLEPQQVAELAHFITETRLQRRAQRQALKPALLAVLNQAQKAQLAELMLNQELRLPRRAGSDGEAGLQRLQEALQLSPAQVAELRSRRDQHRAQNQALLDQRRRQLAAIVGAENAAKLEQRMARKRQR